MFWGQRMRWQGIPENFRRIRFVPRPAIVKTGAAAPPSVNLRLSSSLMEFSTTAAVVSFGAMHASFH
jgi:hypothetical protein